ncbi:unnamed protein product, partial [Musa banksii]
LSFILIGSRLLLAKSLDEQIGSNQFSIVKEGKAISAAHRLRIFSLAFPATIAGPVLVPLLLSVDSLRRSQPSRKRSVASSIISQLY